MTYKLIPPELEEKLNTCTNLPSPPTYALKVIELFNDPEVDIEQAAKVFSLDPAVASKILRLANSPLYANQGKVGNLKLAILVLGLNATTFLALSFSLVHELRQKSDGVSFDYPLYWKRTGLAAAASRVLGQHCKIPILEELFIASLLQDMGMLALNQVYPDLYANPDLNQLDHGQVVSHEFKTLGASHALVGGWLLAQWNLPSRLQVSVVYSEDPLQFSSDDELTPFVRCVAGAGVIANLLLQKGKNNTFQMAKDKLEAWLGLSRDDLAEILKQMPAGIVEVDHLFEMNISNEVNIEGLIDLARESQLQKNIEVCQEVEQLKADTTSLESQYERLLSSSQRDGLTNVFNRAFLDEFLEKAFQKSLRDGTPLSIGFIDLDHFKKINDSHGHLMGDQVLVAASEILSANARSSDLVGRYGGEEFLVVLPGAPSDGAKVFFDRILEVFRETRHIVSQGQPITFTASVGGVTHSQEHPFSNVRALVHAADQALYEAKNMGRDQYVEYLETQ